MKTAQKTKISSQSDRDFPFEVKLNPNQATNSTFLELCSLKLNNLGSRSMDYVLYHAIFD